MERQCQHKKKHLISVYLRLYSPYSEPPTEPRDALHRLHQQGELTKAGRAAGSKPVCTSLRIQPGRLEFRGFLFGKSQLHMSWPDEINGK